MLRNDNCLRGVPRTLDAVGVLAADRVAEIDGVINRIKYELKTYYQQII